MKSRNQMNSLMLSGLLALSLISCKQQTATPTSADYKTLTVTTTDRTTHSSYSASIQGKQDVEIYPQVSGLITKVCIKEGASVKKGQTLFVIDQVPYKAALETAFANVKSAEASVATAQMTADSKAELYKDGIISDFDLTSARNALRQQKAALAQARAELTNARNNLSYTEVKSPVDGTAGMIPYRIGALVGPSITTPLVTVSDNNEMYAYFSMTEKQMLYLTGQYGSTDNAMKAMSGSAGWTNNGGVGITNPGKWLLDAVGSLTQPLFNKGQNIANLKIAKAQQEEALLAFSQKLLDAGAEVNNALTQWQTARKTMELDHRRTESLESAVRSTQKLMRHGTTNYLEVLTAQQTLLSARLTEVTDKYDEIQGVINLYHALGGGAE